MNMIKEQIEIRKDLFKRNFFKGLIFVLLDILTSPLQLIEALVLIVVVRNLTFDLLELGVDPITFYGNLYANTLSGKILNSLL